MSACGRDDHGLTEAQVEYLLRAVQRFRVGEDGKGFAHMQQQDIRAHLTRCFGFTGWDGDTTDMQLVFETVEHDRRKKNKKGEEYGDPFDAWTVCYRARYVLDITAPCGCQVSHYAEWSSGEATNQPSRADAHDLAMKAAESQAMKRCATNLGDQFGLSLYNKGSMEAFVKFTLVRPGAAHVEDAPEPPAPQPESLERTVMPPKDVQTNAETEGGDVNTDSPSATSTVKDVHDAAAHQSPDVPASPPSSDERQQQRTIETILAGLARRDGEKPATWVNRLTKSKVDATRFGVAMVEVEGLPLSVRIQSATEEALALLGAP